jgi:hypothetical protein
MSVLLLTTMLMVGADQSPQAAITASVNGKWMVVYAEEKGRRNNSWEQQQATMQDGTLTYQANGKEETLQLKFGPHQTVSVSNNGTTQKGVFIASRDYLCISLQGHAKQGAAEEQETTAPRTRQHHSSGSFILILRRGRAGTAGK